MNYQLTIVAGRLAHTPKLEQTKNGQQYVRMSLATNRNWTDKNGQKQEETEWHNLIAWGKTAEILAQYAEGGQSMLFHGRNQTQSWEGECGKKHYKTEIVVEGFQFGARSQSRAEREERGEQRPAAAYRAAQGKPGGKAAEDAPFHDDEFDAPIINLDEDEAMTSEIPF